jgi:hypothetical protein
LKEKDEATEVSRRLENKLKLGKEKYEKACEKYNKLKGKLKFKSFIVIE